MRRSLIWTLTLVSAAAAGLLLACAPELSGRGCEVNTDCFTDELCLQGACVARATQLDATIVSSDMGEEMMPDMAPDMASAADAAAGEDAEAPEPDMDNADLPDAAPGESDMASPDVGLSDMAAPDMAGPDAAAPDGAAP